MPRGRVKFFNTDRGYGFIAPDDGGSDVFVHVHDVEAAGMKILVAGQLVAYEVGPTRDGRSKAVNLCRFPIQSWYPSQHLLRRNPLPRSQFGYRRRFPRAASQPQQDACAGRNGRYESVPLVGYRCDGFPGLALSG